jgi:hypothetical protein
MVVTFWGLRWWKGDEAVLCKYKDRGRMIVNTLNRWMVLRVRRKQPAGRGLVWREDQKDCVRLTSRLAIPHPEVLEWQKQDL